MLTGDPTNIVGPPGQRSSHAKLTEARSSLYESSASAAIGHTTDMANPLPLQLTYSPSYGRYFSSVTDYLISDFTSV